MSDCIEISEQYFKLKKSLKYTVMVTYVHRWELVRFEEALRPASISKCKICPQGGLDHGHLVYCRDGMAHAKIERGVHKPRDSPLV